MQLAHSGSAPAVVLNSAARLCPRGVLVAMLLLAPLSSALAAGLYISGTPPTTVWVTANVPAYYAFRPTISGVDKAGAKFSIANKPVWASFDPGSGTLTGKLYSTNAGTYSNIAISVTSASGMSSARLLPFSIAVRPKSGTTVPSGPPTISGSPASTTVVAGSAFSFQPAATDPAGRKLTFSVNTKPSWTTFDTTTGRLSGTPTASNVGTTSNIVITATDGVASASLKAFSLTVVQVANGSATLSWLPPTTDTNGLPLTALAGYQIKYGTNASALSQIVQINNPGLTSYMVSNLGPGTWYFGVDAITTSGTQSKLSPLVSKTIR